jgi:hypothetical protein
MQPPQDLLSEGRKDFLWTNSQKSKIAGIMQLNLSVSSRHRDPSLFIALRIAAWPVQQSFTGPGFEFVNTFSKVCARAVPGPLEICDFRLVDSYLPYPSSAYLTTYVHLCIARCRGEWRMGAELATDSDQYCTFITMTGGILTNWRVREENRCIGTSNREEIGGRIQVFQSLISSSKFTLEQIVPRIKL